MGACDSSSSLADSSCLSLRTPETAEDPFLPGPERLFPLLLGVGAGCNVFRFLGRAPTDWSLLPPCFRTNCNLLFLFFFPRFFQLVSSLGRTSFAVFVWYALAFSRQSESRAVREVCPSLVDSSVFLSGPQNAPLLSSVFVTLFSCWTPLRSLFFSRCTFRWSVITP